ncbi:hypothetical protein LP7551_00580 [Roseibium album]|nr:hypothetical protein LP7551_00580 [Roseibium album]
MKSDKTAPKTKITDDAPAPVENIPASAPPEQTATNAIWQQNIRTLIALNVVSVSVAILLFFGLLFSWATIADLNQVREEIDGLKQFEKRIAGNVDLMNAGIQNRLSKIDQRIGLIQSDIRLISTGNRGSNETIEQLSTIVGDSNEFFGAAPAEVMLTPALTSREASGFVPRQSGAGIGVSISPSPAQPDGSSLFRRVVTPDGKVRYERRQ